MDLVENPHVSEFTKKTLEQFGWKKDDPIPADLGDFLVNVKEKLPAAKRVDVLIDVELMTAEQVDHVKKMLAEAKVAVARKQKQETLAATTANMHPSVAAVYSQLQSFEVVDDISTAAADNVKPVEEKPEPEKPAAEPVPTTPIPDSGAVTSAVLQGTVPFCPRCGWDVRQKYEAVPTDRDKEDFLATLLGSTRFKKEYVLFGGKIKILFRGLLAEENKLIYRQLVCDQQQNKISTEAEWFLQMMDYRLSCALEQISDNAGKVLSIMPELLERKIENKDDPLATPLPAQLDYLNKKVLAQETTRRLVSAQLRQFQRLIEGLEAMALEPSFWAGIE